jgi:glycosyltransferase involved in cell wall biosynthesis
LNATTRVFMLYATPKVGATLLSNTALQHLRGAYAARMDSDDVPLPDWLAAGMDFARSFQGVAFGCQAELFGAVADLRMAKAKETDPLRWQAWSLFNDENYHSGLIFRRDVQHAAALSYHVLTVNNDWDFIHRLAQHGAVANLADTLVRIRRHADNSTRVDIVREDRDSVSVAIRRSLLVERLGITPSDPIGNSPIRPMSGYGATITRRGWRPGYSSYWRPIAHAVILMTRPCCARYC